MQSLPLSAKIRMTQLRIRGWVEEYGEDGVYVSFSGGKDSAVLLDIVRTMYPKIPAVFVDTGLEYPEIREFVKGFDNVEWLKPKITFRQVIEKYGYPFISKEVSETVDYARKYLKSLEKDHGENTIHERQRDRETERQRDRET
ncbi:MAG: phosphoadenosine phosphosulfate reductase family protein, partial [Lachnospiraceae bacterium]|nr:phosphoadenosine phosphosulfate reductase family protein [Lachnospiraceae bacterium]